MDLRILAIINTAYVISFVVLVILAVARIAGRYISYKREGLPVPLLLKRDFFFLTGLALPFLSLLIFRFLEIAPSQEVWYPTWIIVSGGLALLGTAYWVYVEYFKIEKD